MIWRTVDVPRGDDRGNSKFGAKSAVRTKSWHAVSSGPEDFVLLRQKGPANVSAPLGAVAQLIERVVRNDEVVGLIPICSTTFPASRRPARREAACFALEALSTNPRGCRNFRAALSP